MLRFVFEIHAARSLTSFNSAFGLLRSICRNEDKGRGGSRDG